MTAFGPLPSIPPAIAASAAGSAATGAAERAAKSDAATHSLAAGRQDLVHLPLEGDPSASADRDADGWTGGTGTGQPRHEQQPPPPAPPEPPPRRRLPDDPRGGTLDVSV